MASCIYARAQFTVYENNFNNDGAEGWTLLNNDENTSIWQLKPANYYFDMMGETEPQVLGTQGMGTNDNWAILPPQDLSFYTGTQLNFTYLKGFFEAENLDQVMVYAATSPLIADMLANGPIMNVTLEGDGTIEPPQEVTKTVAIPVQYNVPDIYLAIRYKRDSSNPSSNYAVELTQVYITAAALGIGGIEGNSQASIIKQNPVGESLQLQLGSAINAGTADLRIYNVSGMLVKETRYGETGIAVGDLSAGMYFVVLQDGSTIERLKFIKK